MESLGSENEAGMWRPSQGAGKALGAKNTQVYQGCWTAGEPHKPDRATHTPLDKNCKTINTRPQKPS